MHLSGVCCLHGGTSRGTVHGEYLHIKARAQAIQEDCSLHCIHTCKRIWILQNHLLPWSTNIFKKCRAGKTIHCSYFALFWQHNMLVADWLSCQSRQVQGCWNSTEQHFQCQWPATNSVGVVSGQRRERTAPVSNSKPTGKISARDFLYFGKVLDS